MLIKRLYSIFTIIAFILPPIASAKVITFDHTTNGAPINAEAAFSNTAPGRPVPGPSVTEYSPLGVTFLGGVILNDSSFGGPGDNRDGDNTGTHLASGPNVLATSDFLPLSDGDTLPGAIEISFTDPVDSIATFIRNGNGREAFTLNGFRDGLLVDSDTVALDTFLNEKGQDGLLSLDAERIDAVGIVSSQAVELKDFAIDNFSFEMSSVADPPGEVLGVSFKKRLQKIFQPTTPEEYQAYTDNLIECPSQSDCNEVERDQVRGDAFNKEADRLIKLGQEAGSVTSSTKPWSAVVKKSLKAIVGKIFEGAVSFFGNNTGSGNNSTAIERARPKPLALRHEVPEFRSKPPTLGHDFLALESARLSEGVSDVAIKGSVGSFATDDFFANYLQTEISAKIPNVFLNDFPLGANFFNSESLLGNDLASGLGTVTNLNAQPGFGTVTIALKQIEASYRSVPEPSSGLLLGISAFLLLSVHSWRSRFPESSGRRGRSGAR